MLQGQVNAPPPDSIDIPAISPRGSEYREPLFFGGQIIPPEHPLYDLIDSILRQPYRPKTQPSAPGEMLRKMRSRSYKV